MVDEDGGLDDEEPESGIFRWMSTLVVLLAVAGFFGLAWYAYKNGGEAIDEKDVDLVKADKTPVKEAPANPGGMQIPNQDKTVYGLISGKAPSPPAVERILPAPEEPLPRGDTETWMSDSVKNKTVVAQDADKALPPAPAPQDNAASTPPKEQFKPAKARAAEAPLPPKQVADASPQTQPAPAAVPPAPAVAPAQPAKAPPLEEKKTAGPGGSQDTQNAMPPEKPAAVSPAAAPPPVGARIQLGAYKSQGEAESNWSSISGQFSDDLKGKQHYIVKADLGKKGVFYRLQVAPFASSGEAEQFCIDFVSAGQSCILARGK